MRFSLELILLGAIGLLGLAAAGQGLVGITSLSRIEANAITVSQASLPGQIQAEMIGAAVLRARLQLYRIVVASPDVMTFDKNQTALTDILQALSDPRQAYQKTLITAEERDRYDSFTSAWNDYQNKQLEIVER